MARSFVIISFVMSVLANISCASIVPVGEKYSVVQYRYATSKQIEGRMESAGLQPATMEDLQVFHSQHPEHRMIVALGTDIASEEAKHSSPVLTENGNVVLFDGDPWRNAWGEEFSFLAIKK